MRRRYTHAEKAAAVAQADVIGIPKAAETSGVPETTLRYWLDRPEFVELRAKTREEKRDGYRTLVALAMARLVDLIPSMEARDLTILLGVAQDKDLLLSGDATSRSETRTFTDELDDHEKAALRDAIDAELERREAAPAAEDAGA